jgi:hypothetical protein
MPTQVRVLFLLSIVALALGWAGLRQGNAALAQRLAGQPAAAERSP